MSGHKRTTITLSQEEYRKLHEAEMRLRFMNEGVKAISEEKRKEIDKQIRTDLEEMQFRQDALIDSLANVNQDITAIEQSTNQALLDQRLSTQTDIMEVIDNYQYDSNVILNTISDQFQHQLNGLIDHHGRLWNWFEEETHKNALNQNQQIQLAQEWLNAASVIDQFIVENFKLSLINHQALKRYESRLGQAHNNLENNMVEAAVVAAQEAYNGFSELRVELENRQAEYQLLVNRAELMAEKILRLFETNQVVPAIDLEGNILPYNITVDFWSNGQFLGLRGELQDVLSDFLGSEHSVDIDQLRRLMKDYFPFIEEKIADIVFTARMEVINAQLRMNIAEIVVQALSGQGYSLDTSCFLSGDERTAYQANLVNLEGSQVIVKVDPVKEEMVSNELHLFTSDAQEKTSHERKQIALEIRHALQDSGLDVGTITASPRVPEGIFTSSKYKARDQKLPKPETKKSTLGNETTFNS